MFTSGDCAFQVRSRHFFPYKNQYSFTSFTVSNLFVPASIKTGPVLAHVEAFFPTPSIKIISQEII